MRRLVTLLVSTVVLAGACSGGSGASAPSSPSAPAAIRLVRIATLEQPLAMAVRTGDPALYIAEKTGKVVAIRHGAADPKPVLDLSQGVSLGSEQGLLGLAFSPDGRYLYVNFTDVQGNTQIEEFVMRGRVADPSSRRVVLTVDQPYANHNGGDLVFGPDGDLYIGLGDGGSGGDPQNNAQSLTTLLGKMLRISPRPSATAPYTIPPDNPFVDEAGARPEIWAYGLRNPWRYSFDLSTGDLWIADVGQGAWEEIDFQPASSTGGENYGWNLVEGTHPYSGDAPSGSTLPVYDYPHDSGACVVTGGYVYRGSAIPSLEGAYVFADFCLGQLDTLRMHNGGVVYQQLGVSVQSPSSFGEDAAGELYVLSLDGGVYRLGPAG